MLKLALLGQPHISLNDDPLTFSTHKAIALLCYLAVSSRTHSRPALAALFWGELAEAAARRNLRVELTKLRRHLAEYIIATRTTLRFNHRAPHWLDVSLLMAAAADPLANLPQTEAAIDLYRGDFLESFFIRDAPEFESWALIEREQLRRRAAGILDNLVNYYRSRPDFDKALHFAQRALILDPTEEETHRHVMHLLAQTGQRSAALAQFERCRQILAQDLNVEPAADTVMLYQQIRDDTIKKADPVVESEQATSLPQAHKPPSNLPVHPTSFVGREAELHTVAGLLGQADCRLVTIAGPGGIGKTRLALEAAHRQLNAFPDGVFYAPLAGVETASLLPASIAEAISLSFSGPADPQTQLLNYLRPRQALLVLDNFEHLLAALDLLLELLHTAPSLKLLVTSRIALNIAEERLLSVSGLPFIPQEGRPIEESCSAVQLFIERAKRVHLSFSPAAEASDMVRTCQLVEGLPLGIELAAAWVRVLSCAEIVKEIERNLSFLETDLDLVPAHQRSLQAVFDYSWSLMPPEIQTVYGKMSVFRGSFTRDAAEKITGASLRALSALIDRSFLQRGADGRYYIHELLRQFATEKLSARVKRTLQQQHATFYANLVQQRELYLMRAGEEQALDEIGAEIENVRAAWQWASEGADQAKTHPLLRGFMPMLTQFYLRRGLYREGKDIFHRTVTRLAARQANLTNGSPATCEEQPDSVSLLLAQMKVKLAMLCVNLGQYDQVKAYAQESLPLLRFWGDKPYLAEGLAWFGYAQARTANYAEAKARLQESLAIYQEIGYPGGIATAMNGLALVAIYLEDYERSIELCQTCLEIFEDMDYQRGMANMFSNLGTTYARQGMVTDSVPLYEKTLQIGRALNETLLIAIALSNLGSSFYSLKHPEQAETYLRQSLDLFHQLGDQRWIIATANILGKVLLDLNDVQGAGQHLITALSEAIKIEAVPDALDSLPPLGRLLLQANKTDLGMTVLYFVIHHPHARVLAQDYVEQVLADFENKVVMTGHLEAQAKSLTLEDVAKAIRAALSQP
jgi:predicted ATPase/DNA-binding SARP family transcriptional activator